MGMTVMVRMGMVMIPVAVIASFMAVVMGVGMAVAVGVAVPPVAVVMIVFVVMLMVVPVFVEFDLHGILRGKKSVLGAVLPAGDKSPWLFSVSGQYAALFHRFQ